MSIDESNRTPYAVINDLPEGIASRRVLNADASAAYIGVSVPTLRRLAKSGVLKAVRLSERRIGWRAADLAAFLDDRAA
jgi:predicted DNA-binding transcriptional regulator AlpA